MMDIQTAAQILGGDVSCGQILAPGPGHSQRDRSMSIKLDPNAQDGILVGSFAGDDFRDCRDHVKALLGIDGDWNSTCGLFQ